MKKTLIVVGAILAAGMVHAATASWIVNGVYQYGVDSKVKASTGDMYSLVLAYSTSDTLGYTIAANSLTFDSTVSKAYSGAILGAGGTGGAGSDQSAYGKGNYYWIALYNSKGAASESAFDYYMVGEALNGDPNAVAPNTPLQLTWTDAQKTWTAAPGGDTPEPTSGLLLLIGMAGLALRRRRA